jgi:hypothetical protein
LQTYQTLHELFTQTSFNANEINRCMAEAINMGTFLSLLRSTIPDYKMMKVDDTIIDAAKHR